MQLSKFVIGVSCLRSLNRISNIFTHKKELRVCVEIITYS